MPLDPTFFLSDPSGPGDLSPTLDFDKNPTVLLVFAANRFTRNSARYYHQRYGIGAMDWRMMVMLTKEPDIPVSRASKVIGIDKAAVSRSLGRLHENALVEAKIPTGDSRRKTWSLTEKGHQLHAEILEIALSRQQKILKGFSKTEILSLNAMLGRLLENISALDEEATEATALS